MILSDDDIRTAAEAAAEKMWPESGYVGWTKDDAEFHRLFLAECLAKLTAGVEVPGPAFGKLSLNDNAHWVESKSGEDAFDRDQLLAYGASQRLAGREQAIEECAKVCADMSMDLTRHDLIRFAYAQSASSIRALAASPQEQKT